MSQMIGHPCAFIRDLRPPKPKFSVDDIPDLTGKIIIVTGGYAGIGKETVLALLRRNAKVYIAARNRTKAEAAIAELKEKTGKEALFLELDLANLKSVKGAVEEFRSKESQVHILYNNGGVFITPIDQLTSDGYDLQFGTNVLGHFYFTQLLLPALLETAKSAPERHVRVITVSSSAHMFHGPGFKWDTLKGLSPARTKYGTARLYGQSKYGNVVVALEFARRYGDQGITSISLNPGSNIMMLPTLSLGALTQLWAGTMPESAAYNGKYLIPWARLGSPREDTQDPETGVKLWEWLEEQVKDV